MKAHIFSTWIIALACIASAQDAPVTLPSVLDLKKGGPPVRAFLMAATNKAVRYLDGPNSDQPIDVELKDINSVLILDPADYLAAVDLYEGRKYEEARVKFLEVKERYKALQPLPNSPSVLAGYYEMECLRKLGKYSELAKAFQSYDKSGLTRESQQRQLELYLLWDAVESGKWEQVESLAKDRESMVLLGAQRAQVAYCYGRALEELKRPLEAMNAYNVAMTADAGNSEVLARDAALRVLELHHTNPDIANAVKAAGDSAEAKGKGAAELVEAAGLASLFEMSIGAGQPLPEKYRYFLKFKPKLAAIESVLPAADPAAPAKPAETAKPAEAAKTTAKPKAPAKADAKKEAEKKNKPAKSN